MDSNTFNTVSTILTVIGLLVSICFTGLALWKQSSATRLQVFDTVRQRIQDLENQITAGLKDLSDPEKLVRFEVFFNEVEWLSFLFNHRLISRTQVLLHYAPTILDWYDAFQSCMPDELKNDKDRFFEFRALVVELRSSQVTSRGFLKRLWFATGKTRFEVQVSAKPLQPISEPPPRPTA